MDTRMNQQNRLNVEPDVDMLPIVYQPIGIVHSPFHKMDEVPRQTILSQQSEGIVKVFSRFSEGLCDLAGFSHLILTVHHHRAISYSLKTIPATDSVPRGVFATRAPKRPNSIGISIVRLESIEDCVLHVRGLDVIDGTPLLDIKPYIPELSRRHGIRLGWLGDALKHRKLVPGKE